MDVSLQATQLSEVFDELNVSILVLMDVSLQAFVDLL
jgi:hypothetical protein